MNSVETVEVIICAQCYGKHKEVGETSPKKFKVWLKNQNIGI